MTTDDNLTTNLLSLEESLPYDTAVSGSAGIESGRTRLDRLLDGILLTPTGEIIPPYWSTHRDKWLADWWKTVDALGLAIKTFTDKAVGVPLNWLPAQAGEYAPDEIRTLKDVTMSSFSQEFAKFTVSYLTQDNGAFLALLGDSFDVPGPDGLLRPGPIKPQRLTDGTMIGVTGFKNLDASRVVRTGDDEWPIVYSPADGGRYLIHCSRVILMSNLESTDDEMHGVGFCFLSLCWTASEYLDNLAKLEGEAMGSRPLKKIMIGKSGITLNGLKGFLASFSENLNNMGLTRYSMTGVIAPETLGGDPIEMEMLNLSDEPDEGIEKEVLRLAMVMSCAGLTLRDVGLAGLLSGQTRADAEVSQDQARTKGVWSYLESFVQQMNDKVPPMGIELDFDAVDDEQDAKQIDMRETVSKRLDRDVMLGIIDIRTARLELMNRGWLDEPEFVRLEAIDGRNVEGLPITAVERQEILGRDFEIEDEEE